MSDRSREKFKSLLEKLIGSELKDEVPLGIALTHSSYVNEIGTSGREDNERYEFLGDAVLSLAVSDNLVERFPKKREGQLSRFRAAMVNEKTLAKAARAMKLGSYLYLGKGEERTKGREKDSILADAFEAIVAAIYLSNGFSDAAQFVRATLAEELNEVHKVKHRQDYKTDLQELTQKGLRTTPTYKLVIEEGPDHNKIFESEVWINDRMVGRGRARSKKESEQACAEAALKVLEEELSDKAL